MNLMPGLVLAVMLALPAAAETILSEASGNWAGSSGTGFTFFARLIQNEDKARLVIWGGGPGSAAVAEGDPQFDNAECAGGFRDETGAGGAGPGGRQHSADRDRICR